MSADKYPSIFSRQMKAIVYLVFNLRGIVVYYQRVLFHKKINFRSRNNKDVLAVSVCIVAHSFHYLCDF